MIEGLIALVVIAGGALVAYFKGRKDKGNADALQEHNEYVSTRKRMDETGGPSDADVSKWLHERGKYKRPGDL